MDRVYFIRSTTNAPSTQKFTVDNDVTYFATEIARNTTHVLYKSGVIECTWNGNKKLVVAIDDFDTLLVMKLIGSKPRCMHTSVCRTIFPNDVTNHPNDCITTFSSGDHIIEMHFTQTK